MTVWIMGQSWVVTGPCDLLLASVGGGESRLLMNGQEGWLRGTGAMRCPRASR